MEASAAVFSSIEDPTTLETSAAREDLALADDFYIQMIFIASDCKVVVEAIKEGSSASFGAIVHEIISFYCFYFF